MILAPARPGMIVLVPSPEKPPQMPFTSSVGRAPRRSSVVQPDSPTSAGTSSSARSASSSNGRAAIAVRSSWAERHDVVVEAGDADPPVGPLEARDDAGEGVDRVLDRAAEDARVHVLEGTLDVDLHRGEAAQADGDRGNVAREEPRVRDQRDVRREPARVRDRATAPGAPSSTPPRLRRPGAGSPGAPRARPGAPRPRKGRSRCSTCRPRRRGRGRARPATIGSNGAASHSSTGSTGWTS